MHNQIKKILKILITSQKQFIINSYNCKVNVLMDYLLIIGLVLAGIGIIGLFGQPKTDKRTKTGIEKGKTTSYGLCFILIITGAGLIYIDSRFFSDEQKSSVNNK